MATLYIQEQGTTVRKRAQQVLITKDDATLQAVPLHKVDQLVLMGQGVQLSTALLVALLSRGIPITLTNQSGSRHYATLSAGPSRFAALRLQQMQRVSDPAWSLATARAIVRAKLQNQRNLLATTGWPAASAAVEQIVAAERGLASATFRLSVALAPPGSGMAAKGPMASWRARAQVAADVGAEPLESSNQPVMASPAKPSTLPPKRSTSVMRVAKTRLICSVIASVPRRGPRARSRASVSGVKPDRSAKSAAPWQSSGSSPPNAKARARSCGR